MCDRYQFHCLRINFETIHKLDYRQIFYAKSKERSQSHLVSVKK